jgi:hypothetical protein
LLGGPVPIPATILEAAGTRLKRPKAAAASAKGAKPTPKAPVPSAVRVAARPKSTARKVEAGAGRKVEAGAGRKVEPGAERKVEAGAERKVEARTDRKPERQPVQPAAKPRGRRSPAR